MELKSLKLKSFLSHASTEVDFASNRKVLIDGVSGAGKTAIVEAIVWALFGRGRSENRGMVKKGTKKATVDLTLVSGDKEYVIRRSVSDKGSQTIEISLAVEGRAVAVPATSIKEKQRFIEKDILKSSYELFVNAVIWPQDNTNSFVRQPASVRKNLLLEIVGTGSFDEFSDKAKEKLSSITMLRSSAENEIRFGAEAVAADIAEVAEFDANPVDSQSMAVAMLNAESEHTHFDERAGTIRAAIPVLQEAVSARRLGETLRKAYLAEKEQVLGGMNPASWEENANMLKEQLDKIVTDKVMFTVLKAVKEQNAAVERQRASVELEKAGATSALESKRSTMKAFVEELGAAAPQDALCPNTGNICERAKELIDSRKSVVFLAMKDTSASIDSYTRRISDADAALEELKIIPLDEDRLKTLEESVSRESKVSVAHTDVVTRIARLAAIEANISKHPEIPDLGEAEKLVEYEKDLRNCTEQSAANWLVATTIKGQLDLYNQRREEIMKKRIRIAEYEKRSEELKRELEKTGADMENLTLVKDALGSNGIKVVIVDTILPKLELRINEVLSELTDFRVKLDTQRASASDADKMVEGLFITVINGEGEDLDYDGYSGGEKLKISVAITEALAELQNSSFRILDEMVVGLDAESVGQFSEILLKLQSRFSQIIAISHLPEVKQLFDDKITVTKKNGTSSII